MNVSFSSSSHILDECCNLEQKLISIKQEIVSLVFANTPPVRDKFQQKTFRLFSPSYHPNWPLYTVGLRLSSPPIISGDNKQAQWHPSHLFSSTSSSSDLYFFQVDAEKGRDLGDRPSLSSSGISPSSLSSKKSVRFN